MKQPKQSEQKVNERNNPRRYLLTTLREGGYYEPLTDKEFEEFTQENPDLAKYFLDGESIDKLPMPEAPDSAPIYDHWEKAAHRMLQNLSRNTSAWIFQEPVNVETLKIPDYYDIVKRPMDFGTVK